MLNRFKLSVLLQGLTLLLLGPACEASSLGMTVHVVPLDSDGGHTVEAHFTVIAPSPCPDFSGVCVSGEPCQVHTTSLPYYGTKPDFGWCVRQWQKNISSNYKALISLGSNTEFYVSMNAGPKVRENSGRLNQPAFVALPPPLRAQVNCPHHIDLSVKDLDGDKVRCRFAHPDQGECLNCIQHSFVELDEEKCILSFTGNAPAGQYFVYLMVEDFIPAPKMIYTMESPPLSSVPVHLSLTVEESTSSCSDEPVATEETPKDDSVLYVLPYQEVKFHVNYLSQLESILEIAVVGPPELYRIGFTSVGPFVRMTMAWIRSENNKLPRILPICFAANTKSLQSEPRCVWLYQREIRTPPAGTELKCEKGEMTLMLPVASLSNVNLAELQLNSPTCPVIYNSTHLTAHISLTDCGTQTVHSGSELVYTNTLHSVRSYSMISRNPFLILPLICRIPGAQVHGPQYAVSMPSEIETFGYFRFWLELHHPGEGPLAKFTSSPKFRSNFFLQRTRRDAESGTGNNTTPSSTGYSKNLVDLHVMSNCSMLKAELIVSKCVESAAENNEKITPILDKGCVMSSSIREIDTTEHNVKIYRLDLNKMLINESTITFECVVNLCMTTVPSHKCPDLCNVSLAHSDVVGSVFTSSYIIRSGPVSLVGVPSAPLTTTVTTTTITAAHTTTSQAPEQTSSTATGVILTTISIFLHIY